MSLSRFGRGAACALLLCAAGALAQQAPAGGPPAAEPAKAAPAAAPAPAQSSQASQAAPAQGGQTFDSVINPAANEEARRQRSQPLNNAPVWREVRSGEAHYTSIPGREVGVLIQSGGESWRQRRNNQLIPFGGLLFAGVFALCVLFYLWRGTIPLKEAETGRKVQRFTGFERFIHWTVAITFSLLAISGLTMAFGKFVLLPIVGHTLFALLTVFLKTLHNFVGPVFSVAVVVMFFTFIRDNWPKGYDIKWLLKGGGLATGEHIPSDKFNAGEKLWFWGGVLFLGMIVSASGFVLDFPNFDQTRATMQLANVVHLVGTVLMMTAALGHIYMGTVGMAGAFNAMKTGYVDEAWAKEHHEYWYNKIKGKGAPPASGGPLPAAAHAPVRD
jgi:formate dehydrogenase subunit gamma